jgi:hypothetical protein
MHALSGTSSHASTFPLFLHVGKMKLVALVDSGSTTSFIDPAVIEKSSITISNHDPEQVTVANGSVLWTHAMTTSCSYYIQGHDFNSAFKVLELQGYDIILVCGWIYEHSLVGLNLKTREFSIEKNGTKLTLVDETLSNKHLLVTHKKIKKLLRKGVVGALLYVHALQMLQYDTSTLPSIKRLLNKYMQVFEEPTQLPPTRTVDHKIPLQPGAPIVNSRPYRLSHKQKDTMEELVATLLKNQVIQPSVIPYSSLAILVKKKDGICRLCIDYRKLSNLNVKNKFPIPLIEDLLDELHGATIFSKIDLRFGYHHIRMHYDDIPKTAFRTHQGHFEYIVMPFGLTNAHTTFQTLMNQLR